MKARLSARQRIIAILDVEARVYQGMDLTGARAAVAAAHSRKGLRCSAPTLARWAKRVEGEPRKKWLRLLKDRYVGRTSTGCIPPAAWDMFITHYLALDAPSPKRCYDKLQLEAKANSWRLPCLRTFQRRLAKS